MILLLAAGVLSFVAYGIDPSQTLNAVLGGVLFGVVVVTVLMSFSQERKTIKTMAAFKNILPSTAVVIRDGQQKDMEARNLVVGDIVLLSLGQKVFSSFLCLLLLLLLLNAHIRFDLFYFVLFCFVLFCFFFMFSVRFPLMFVSCRRAL